MAEARGLRGKFGQRMMQHELCEPQVCLCAWIGPGKNPKAVTLPQSAFKNFRSIEKRQTLSLAASSDSQLLRENVISGVAGDLRLLRSAVIYGPNAAGRSNLVRALKTLQELVQNSAMGIQEGQHIPVTPIIVPRLCTGGHARIFRVPTAMSSDGHRPVPGRGGPDLVLAREAPMPVMRSRPAAALSVVRMRGTGPIPDPSSCPGFCKSGLLRVR